MDRYSHGISHGEEFAEDDPAGMWVMFDDAQAAIAAAVSAERERCAKLCDDARAAIWDYHDKQVRDTAETVCINLAVRIRGA